MKSAVYYYEVSVAWDFGDGYHGYFPPFPVDATVKVMVDEFVFGEGV